MEPGDTCNQCGFTYDLDETGDAAAAITASAAELATALVDCGQPRLRPRPGVWSPLEYACHVRDVLLVQRERVLLARRAERPDPPPMGRDEREEHDGYGQQDPVDVARQLRDAADLFANVLDRLGQDDWARTLYYGYPERQERSLRWVAVHTWHEVVHHNGDVRAQTG